jgi:hypothetical protein
MLLIRILKLELDSLLQVRLTIMIEDPREEERREELAVENERGCSRDDMAAALVDVSD